MAGCDGARWLSSLKPLSSPGRAWGREEVLFLGEHGVRQSQRLADGPRLERAAARRVRGVAVGDLGEVPDSGAVQVFQERAEEARPGLPPGLGRAAADAHP